LAAEPFHFRNPSIPIAKQPFPGNASARVTTPTPTYTLGAVGAGLILFGIVVRIVGYLQNSSLNGDEAMLALNLGTRTFKELLAPLDYGQVATVPFLWAERIVTLMGGVSEYTLRAIPLMTGIGLLWVVYRLADSLLGRVQAILALALSASSYPLIRYSLEIKPYIVDSLVASLLVWVAIRLMDDLDSLRWWAGLALAGSVGVLLSNPALLVVAGLCAGLAAAAFRTRRRYLLPRLALLVLLWGSIFSSTYVLWYAPNAGAPYMREFWSQSLLGRPSPDFGARLWSGLAELSCTVTCWRGAVELWPVLLLLMVIGLLFIWRQRGPQYAILVIGPVLAVFGASLLERYPLATRLLLFTAPLVSTLVASGVAGVASLVEQMWPKIRARWILTLAVYPTLVLALALVVAPPSTGGFYGTEVKPLGRHFMQHSEGEPVYVYPRAAPAWVFHTTDWAHPDTSRLDWVASVAGPDGPAFINGASRGRRQVGDGDTLIYSSALGTELYGTSSGIQVRRGYLSSPEPDPGWAESEAERIRRAARPHIWLIIADAHSTPVERTLLLRAISDAGGRVVSTQTAADAMLIRLQFTRKERM
jgi:Dolichyl-phosphate-mannose-protein mannosyltransferase